MNSLKRHYIESILYPLLAGIGLIACLLIAPMASAGISNPYATEPKVEMNCLTPMNCDHFSSSANDHFGFDCAESETNQLVNFNKPFWTKNILTPPPCNMSIPRSPAHDQQRGSGVQAQGSHT